VITRSHSALTRTALRPRSQPARRPRVAHRLVGTAVASLLLFGLPALSPLATGATRPFAATSPFNVRIKSRPALDPNSAAMVARAARRDTIYANHYAFGIPIYTASSTTPRYRVTCAMEGQWGSCPLSQRPMPIPVGAKPSTGSDGVLAVIDPQTNTVGEYWQAAKTGSTWKASWGAVNSLTGSGWGGGSTGAGASRLAGVIRVSEISRGVIDHALVLQSDNVCTDVVRPPALKTDGTSTRFDCIPEGSRLQLDPSINLSTIKGLTSAERTVARALQTYGGYLIDRGGASLSVSFERAADAGQNSTGSVYKKAGLGWDYYGMSRVPWERLRVLKTWQG
jgi:hypothetical protein